jgi:hypothetical protein
MVEILKKLKQMNVHKFTDLCKVGTLKNADVAQEKFEIQRI